MAKIKIGDQFDESEANVGIRTDGQSKTEIELGDQHDKSKRKVKIDDNGPNVTPQTSPPLVPKSSDVWMKGSFFLASFVVVVGLLCALFRLVPWYAFPAIVIACVMILYLFGVLVMSKTGVREQGFLKILGAFVKVVKGPSE